MSSSFYDVAYLNLILKYNQATDDWINPDQLSRFGRRDLFFCGRALHDKSVPVIESFPDRWRKDEVIAALISLILIFNPDQVDLNFPDSVRHEQFVYIHLLKRYLESVCESPCDASDNLYRLVVAVEKFRELSKVVWETIHFSDAGYHRSLRNLIINVINNK